MAGSKESLLSLDHLNSPNVNNFSIRNLRKNTHKTSQTIRLQQRWHELKDRERAAQHHNKDLLQQFNRAQDMLRDMLAATASMKTIRMDYEQFLVGNSSYRQKQLKEKTQIHHSKKTEDNMNACLNRKEEHVSTSGFGKSYSHGHSRNPRRDCATQAYNGRRGYHRTSLDSRSSHSNSDRTITAPAFPLTLLQHSQNFQLQHLIATPSHPQSSNRQNPPGWAHNQTKGHQSSEVSSPDDAETSVSLRRKSFHLLQELDFKPVRLCSEHVENEDSSSTESKQMKSEKKRKTRNTSSEKDRSSLQKSSRTSPAAVAQTSESEASSHKGSSSRMRRNVGVLIAGLPMTVKNGTQDRESCESRSTSESQSEHAVTQSPLNQSESSSKDSSPSQSEESSDMKDNKEKLEEDDKEKGQKADIKSDESDVEEDNEDEETSPEDEREEESDEDQDKNKEQDSALLQEKEGDDDESVDNVEEDKSDEEEQTSEEKAEDRDSDDVIISPQQNKPRVHFPQEHSEVDSDGKEGDGTGTSDEDSSETGDEDIEKLLAPQPQTEENDIKSEGESKVICNVEIFHGDPHKDLQSDSDDNFYD